jgi:2-phosphoglycerate kinase
MRDRDLTFAQIRELMLPCLATTGLDPERAWTFVRRVDDHVKGDAERRLSLEELRAIAREVLGERVGDGLAERFRRWHDVEALQRPLVILIGGASGVGKSTIATRLARELGITRVSSTDFIRQVLRAVVPNAIAPELYRSSFELDSGPSRNGSGRHDEFERQVREVMVGVRATIERAVREGTSVILEGVHLFPGLVDLEAASQCLVVHVVLSVEDQDDHERRFMIRATTSARPAERYDESLRAIRALQDHVVTTARRTGVAVIDNRQEAATVLSLVDHILAAADAALRQPVSEPAPR